MTTLCHPRLDASAKITHLVDQLDLKAGGISVDSFPLNSLRAGPRLPDSVLGRRLHADGVGEGEGSEERRDDGGRVHCVKWTCVCVLE